MPDEGGGVVLRNPCALTLSDEPLAGAVEHGAMQLRVEAAEGGPESGPTGGFCRHQTYFYIIITIT